ncbi:Uncharacterised protein [Porphyromonas cangingivalis]|uniref:hypothetical protein n=1 Tax=Porphyromonas cangingivalis TaxID=36874 RepID=UPI000D99BEA5|nr:hypothetical protein [Porphyromonas cangingivalis]SPY34979.1 Uncharacterised protein [Porphyromonas cangingivalis]
MALAELQRKKLIEGINSISINSIIKYIQTGDITLDDVPHISAERRQYILDQQNSMPNPVEQQEWQTIEMMLNMPSVELMQKLSSYISRWEAGRPADNHVDLAKQKLPEIESLIKLEAERVEKEAWNAVDPFSMTDLIGYLSKYPNTIHKSEIDDSIWSLVDQESVQEIQNYITLLPQGIHVREAQVILNAIVEWNNVKLTNDIFCIKDYIRNNPNTPFKNQAQIQLMGLKQQEIGMMRSNPNSYEVNRLLRLINDSIFSDNELINAKVMTDTVLETLRNHDINADLPDIRQAIENSRAECKDGYTDVFFFGVPSTGKTCVLMGMSRSNSLHINLASGGGDYAAVLQQYTDVGVTVPRTPGTFVTTLEATISSVSDQGGGVVHKINLVEMSGEEFAFDIANNPDKIFTFEQMGSGATQLLKNDNRKVFFLIIDPTANVVRINREVETQDGFDEETGQPIIRTDLQYCVVNQRTLIQKMVDLFTDPGNAEIMKKVDSIHIIMTKSDTLGNPVEREEKALNIFQQKFSGDILKPLIDLCEEYNINSRTNFHPNLYTFSLGTFYVGGLYEYEQTDSDRLVVAIKNSTQSVKKKSWWDRLKETVN